MSYLKNKELKALLKIFKDDNKENISSLSKRNELLKMYNQHLENMVKSILRRNKTHKNLLKGGLLLYSMEKMKKGGGLFDKLKDYLSTAKKIFKPTANLYRATMCQGKSRPLMDGELHFGCHNFTGPGTILNNQTKNVIPYNNIDNCSKKHDLEFERIKNSNMSKEERAMAVQRADKEAIDCYNKFPNQNGYLPAKLGIQGKLTVDELLSYLLGKPTALYGGLIDEIINVKEEINKKKKKKKITRTNIKVSFEDLEPEQEEKQEEKQKEEKQEQKEDMEILEQQDIIQKLRDLGYLISPDRKNNNFKFRLKGKSVGVSTKMKPYLEDDKTINRENLLIAASQLIQKENLQL